MIAGEQLSMFEPTGAELPLLASRHAQKANSLARAALTLQERGLVSVASALAALSRSSVDDAMVCETALQFERLGGLQ